MIIACCDLCGKPINETGRHFKVKERKFSWHESWWEYIDVHDDCVKELLKAIKQKESEEE